MELNIIDSFRIIKIVQSSNHKADARYGASRGKQCSGMPLMSVSWTLFKLPYFCELIDLDSILQKRDESFKFINRFRNLVVEVLPQRFLIENCLIDIEFLENRLGQITAGAYYISITKIISSCQEARSGTLLIVKSSVLA